MPETKTQKYLDRGGPELFRSHTSRWYASRSNKLLLKIDEALEDYLTVEPANVQGRLNKLNAIDSRIFAWECSKRDKVAALKHSFRMPYVQALKDEVRETAAVYGLKLRKQEALRKENEDHINGLKKMEKDKHKAQGHEALKGFVKRVANVHQPSKVQMVKSAGVPVRALWGQNVDEAIYPQHLRGDELRDYLRRAPTDNVGALLADPPADLKMAMEGNTVHYLDDLVIRCLFEVDFQGNKLYSRITPQVQQAVMSKTKTRKELFDAAPVQVLDTAGWQSNALAGNFQGWACFVMSMYDVIYVGVHEGGRFHHSSFLCGAPVLAAGMIKVEQGIITGFHEKNGHYKCSSEHMMRFFKIIEQRTGTDLSKVKFSGALYNDESTVAEQRRKATDTPQDAKPLFPTKLKPFDPAQLAKARERVANMA
ncbi:MAG: hypothetical protein JNK87_16715 [Bryobacterales bacterium]|nr:hypothetical protein [Bryobacterales bacterium]